MLAALRSLQLGTKTTFKWGKWRDVLGRELHCGCLFVCLVGWLVGWFGLFGLFVRSFVRSFVCLFGACLHKLLKITLPETNIAPENQWLKDDISFWGPAYFPGRAVSFREGTTLKLFSIFWRTNNNCPPFELIHVHRKEVEFHHEEFFFDEVGFVMYYF